MDVGGGCLRQNAVMHDLSEAEQSRERSRAKARRNHESGVSNLAWLPSPIAQQMFLGADRPEFSGGPAMIASFTEYGRFGP